MSDKLPDSYWSKRRRIRVSVNAHLADIANESQSLDADTPGPSADTARVEALPQADIAAYADLLNCMLATDVLRANSVSRNELTGYEYVEESDGWSRCSDSFSDLSSSDVDSDSVDEPSDECLVDEIAVWANEFHISPKAVGALMKILRPFHPRLPMDGRTVTHAFTSNSVCVTPLAGGFYHHFGIESCLNQLHIQDSLPIVEGLRISIQVNIDGLPLFRSSGMQLWPILGLVKEPVVTREPFVIGVFGGMKKPTDVGEYLKTFVCEAKTLQDNGFVISGHKVFLNLHSFVCDAPARSFLKKTKSFNGYHGCERCTQNGLYVAGRMTFPDIQSIPRNDQSFADMLDEEHHVGDVPSPLSELSIGLVTGFVLDYMHLICLGVVRRLLLLWLRGPLPTRLPANTVNVINDRLISIHQFTPCEFSRRPRSLYDIDRWKATEFRQFVLFTGPVVLLNNLREELYNNFLLLHVAMTCLLSSRLCSLYVDYADKLLKHFVVHGCKIYGPQFAVYNVHNLIHLCDDARRFGPLDNISSFPFENFLGRLKKLVRSPHLPLQQIVNRLSEQQLCRTRQINKPYPTLPCLKGLTETDFSVSGYDGSEFYSCLQTDEYTLRTKDRDNCVWLLDGKIGRVQYIFLHDAKIRVVVRLFESVESFYSYPLQSEMINAVRLRTCGSINHIYLMSDIKKKCYCIPLQDGSYFAVPLCT